MEEYILVNVQYIDLDNGEKINNLINSNQINYTIYKNKNKYELDWLINNYNINIKDLIYNNLGSTLIIITKEDYNSLLGLLYSDNKQLLNYNDMYYIISMDGYMTFNSNDNLNTKLKKKFIEKLNTSNC